MHFVLNYSISEACQSKEIVKDQVLNALSGYQYYVVFSSTIVVGIAERSDWEVIRSKLTTVAKAKDGDLHFIMSPVLTSGKYDGWLPASSWPVINKLSSNE